MNISSKSLYSILALVDVARAHPEKPVAVRSICERYGVSINCLEKYLFTLRRSGLIRSVRGPGGGYVLTKEPSEIRLLDIIRITEGPFQWVRCLQTADNQADCLCEYQNGCLARIIWLRLVEKIDRIFWSIRLDDLAFRTPDIEQCLSTGHFPDGRSLAADHKGSPSTSVLELSG